MASPWRISEALSLALHGTAYLAAHPDERIPVRTMGTELGFSLAHLWAVMGKLEKAGIVAAVRGPKGGFTLARPAKKIALLEVYEAIEGKIEIRECLLPSPTCANGICLFDSLHVEVNSMIKDYLKKTKLSDVAGTYGG
ncbi:MAG: RrF2 family transcriptional regulator [Planctomycetota bacterium]|jgi:Rrf2 family protein